MNRHQQSWLKFIRRSGRTALELFLLWRHAEPGNVPDDLWELSSVTDAEYAKLPMRPAATGLFSGTEIEAVLWLARRLDGPLRRAAWRLLERCVWERMFPELFAERWAGRILSEAYKADDLATWMMSCVTPMEAAYAAVANELEELPAYRVARDGAGAAEPVKSLCLWVHRAQPVGV